MKLEQSFEVDAPLERVWQALLDVERVAPCLPGAAVTGRNEDGSYNGTFTIKIGPTTASYAGKLEMRNIDDAARSATLYAQGSDRRGQGGATATISSRVTAADGSTRVEVVTDYHITGRLARFGRGGMIEDISERLLREFAGRLQSSLSGAGAAAAAETGPSGDATEVGRAEAEPVPPPTEVVAAASAQAPDVGAVASAAPVEKSDEEQPTQPFERLHGGSPLPAEREPSADRGPEAGGPAPPAEAGRPAAPGEAGRLAPPGAPEAEAAVEPPAPSVEAAEPEPGLEEPPAPPIGPEPGAAAPPPPSPPATPPGPPSPTATPPATPPPLATKPAPPMQGLSLVGSALVGRVRRNPKPLIAVAGGLIVLGMLRRRR